MILFRARPLLSACLMAGLLGSGCSQKKPVVSVPQTPAAPAPQPSPQPSAEQEQTQQPQTSATQGTPPPEAQTAPAQAQPPPATEEKTDAAKAKTTKPRTNGKKASSDSSRRTTVKDEAEAPPTTGPISPSLTGTEVAHNQTTIDQLLQSTEATLNGIKRQFSQDELAIVAQIHDYINQSRQAVKGNDLTRAYNLAMKARLLADDLAKR